MNVPVGVSGRHIHLTREQINILFGDGYVLTKQKDLSQPGQFAACEKVDVVSLEGKVLAGVRILGPERSKAQVEISRSDAIRNKFVAPVRSSGDTQGSGPCKVIGPKGSIDLEEGVIVADRHIHFSLEEGEKFGVKDREVVAVKVPGIKGGIMFNVLCRVKPNFKLECHIDTDDAAAFALSSGDTVELIKE